MRISVKVSHMEKSFDKTDVLSYTHFPLHTPPSVPAPWAAKPTMMRSDVGERECVSWWLPRPNLLANRVVLRLCTEASVMKASYSSSVVVAASSQTRRLIKVTYHFLLVWDTLEKMEANARRITVDTYPPTNPLSIGIQKLCGCACLIWDAMPCRTRKAKMETVTQPWTIPSSLPVQSYVSARIPCNSREPILQKRNDNLKAKPGRKRRETRRRGPAALSSHKPFQS
ncbi:hypothetical protein B0H66DRAFT_321551 [Apodospora peruviana]|uniref:Uncharacterized protein n=1 Tax=Apodospora peruviana TaxID=516989 RepID=A0AAE0M0T7_9PEZI|nr:hypothetical protein B0H66DRAFT_321551 [Apodospora peruviana]